MSSQGSISTFGPHSKQCAEISIICQWQHLRHIYWTRVVRSAKWHFLFATEKDCFHYCYQVLAVFFRLLFKAMVKVC